MKKKVMKINKATLNEKQVSVSDLDTFKRNSRDTAQLIMVAINNVEMDHVPGLKDQLSKATKFLDDMAFFFSVLTKEADKRS